MLGDDRAGEVPGQAWQFQGQGGMGGGMGGIGGGAGYGGMARGGRGDASGPAGPSDGFAVGSGRDPSQLAAGLGVAFDVAEGKPVAAGLASLTVDVPTRVAEFLFTTPRGDIEITAHAVEQRFVVHAVRAGLVIGCLLATVAGNTAHFAIYIVLEFAVVCLFSSPTSSRIAALKCASVCTSMTGFHKKKASHKALCSRFSFSSCKWMASSVFCHRTHGSSCITVC